jgi:DGQHR domain-containing protein
VIDAAEANGSSQRTKVVTKVPALRILQDGVAMYLTKFTGATFKIEGFSRPDAWSTTNREGYQRPPKPKRFLEIARYLLGLHGLKGLLPQAVILNCRESLIFTPHPDSPDGDFGTLTITTGMLPLYEVDGQNRLGGLREAIDQDETGEKGMRSYPIPTVILDGVERILEAVEFYVLNEEQQRVPTDIAQRLIAQQMGHPELRDHVEMENKAWIAKGTQVVDDLVKTKDQPWYRNIGIPGEAYKAVIRQVSFIQSLKPILTDDVYSEEDPDDIAEILVLYWRALKDTWPEAFDDPTEFVIQKTVGLFPLHALLKLLTEHVRRTEGVITEAGFKRVLAELKDELEDDNMANFWHKDNGEAGKYAGAKGFKRLEGILKDHLPPLKSSLRLGKVA